MSIEIQAYKCKRCGGIYEEESEADRCCTCKKCKHFIGNFDAKLKYVHCAKGYSCDSFASRGKEGTYTKFE